jgi:hypothetical protein
LIPLLKPERLADGRWEDVRIDGETVTVDVRHKRNQLWHDLPEIAGTNVTLRAQVRIPAEAQGGYTKLTLMAPGEPDYSLLISDATGRRHVRLESSEQKGLSRPIDWPGQPGEYVDIALALEGDRIRAEVAGIIIADVAVKAGVRRSAAIGVGGWISEIRGLEAELPAQAGPE